jgi:hypothetical protein
MRVIPAPKTGKVVMSKMLTTAIDQEIKQKFKIGSPIFLEMCNETKKVIAPSSDDSPKT